MSCGRTLSVPLEWRRVCRRTSSFASRVSRTLSRLKREGRISLQAPQQKRASSRVEGRISWFFSSCSSKLGVPLELRCGPQGPDCVASVKPVSIRVVRGLSEFLSNRCWVLCPHLELRPEPLVSSPVLTRISGFLWSFHRGVTPRLVWRHSSPLSTRAVTIVSGFLSS